MKKLVYWFQIHNEDGIENRIVIDRYDTFKIYEDAPDRMLNAIHKLCETNEFHWDIRNQTWVMRVRI